MKEIGLTTTEIMQGALVGVMRQVQNIRDRRQDKYGASNSKGWQLHIEGALGEMALAKFLDLYWGGVGTFRGSDVGKSQQVRTRSRHNYELMLHPDDDDEQTYWLLTGTNGTYRVHGWLRGADGKKDHYWKDPAGGRPAFFVPQSDLNKQEN